MAINLQARVSTRKVHRLVIVLRVKIYSHEKLHLIVFSSICITFTIQGFVALYYHNIIN